MAKSILIIDDEELVTKSLLKLLKKAGYAPVVSKSGKDALEKIKANDFDLIVSDVRMPEMDGIETIQQIRAYCMDKNKKCPPEIVITGYADKEKYERAMELKVADYLYKPFDTAQFLSIVKKVIG